MRAAVLAIALIPAIAAAQELEPRAYSNAPVGTSFAIVSYTRLSGPVLFDPSLPIKDVQATINMYTLGYARFVELFGRSANFAIVAPYISGDLSGQVRDAPTDAHRAGPGDLRLRGAINLFGQAERTAFNASFPNRWAYKPEVGLSYPIGRWFTEASAGVWLFTDNDDFASGHRRSQDPLETYQFHVGYNFRPGLWLAADFGHYIGGRTSIDGSANDDAQRNSRVGLVLSAPIAPGWSTKVALSKGTVVRVGGDYRIATLALQYRWLD